MLILTSYGFRSPIVSEKLKNYIDCTDKTILVIPFAGFNNANTARREVEEGIVPFGFGKDKIYICDKDKPQMYKNIKFDYIYVPGGNPFKMLKEMNEAGIMPWLKAMIDDGSNYIGVSAGADLCSEDLSYLKIVEDNDYEMNSYAGLGLIEENILCHADQRDMGTIKNCRDYSPEKKMLLLKNDEVYVVNN